MFNSVSLPIHFILIVRLVLTEFKKFFSSHLSGVRHTHTHLESLLLSPFLPSLFLTVSGMQHWSSGPAHPQSSRPSVLGPAPTLNIQLVLADLLIFVPSYFPPCCCKTDTYSFNQTSSVPPSSVLQCRSVSVCVCVGGCVELEVCTSALYILLTK